MDGMGWGAVRCGALAWIVRVEGCDCGCLMDGAQPVEWVSLKPWANYDKLILAGIAISASSTVRNTHDVMDRSHGPGKVTTAPTGACILASVTTRAQTKSSQPAEDLAVVRVWRCTNMTTPCSPYVLQSTTHSGEGGRNQRSYRSVALLLPCQRWARSPAKLCVLIKSPWIWSGYGGLCYMFICQGDSTNIEAHCQIVRCIRLQC